MFLQHYRNNTCKTQSFHRVVWAREAIALPWASLPSSALNILPMILWPNYGSPMISLFLSTGIQTPPGKGTAYLRGPPVCLCSPGQMSLHSVKIRVLVPRKKDGRWNHRMVPWALQAPLWPSVLGLLCAFMSSDIKWLLSQIKTQGHFEHEH